MPHLARHLADEHHERGRILEGRVDTDRCIGCPGSPRHETHARSADQLAIGIGHRGCASFVAADDERNALLAFVKGVQNGQIALSGNAKGPLDTLFEKTVDQKVRRAPRLDMGFMHHIHPLSVRYRGFSNGAGCRAILNQSRTTFGQIRACFRAISASFGETSVFHGLFYLV